MSFARILFVAQGRRDEDVDRLRASLGRVEAFYALLGDARLRSFVAPELRLVYGCVELDEPPPGEELLVWGEPPPAALGSARALLTAPDGVLRAELRSISALLAVGEDEARLLSGSANVATLHEAHGADASAWSSHATAAGLLAHGRATLRAEAVPELLAGGVVGTNRTLVAEAIASSTALSVRFTPRGSEKRTWWPPADRWRPVAQAHAALVAEAELLRSAEELARGRRVVCGLTSGLDSRVCAAALARSGVGFEAITVGGAGDPDAVGGQQAAVALGVPHRRFDVPVASEVEVLAATLRDARWNEGAAGLSRGSTLGRGDGEVFVHGGGGETARAYYYRLVGRNHVMPSSRQLRHVFRLADGLPGATSDVEDLLDARTSAWIADAEATGARGWRVLDVVAAEQRMRRIYRALLVPSAGGLAAPFCTPDVQRALASLPLDDRLTSGWHVDVLARWAPSLPVEREAAQRPGTPAVVRRAAARARRLRRAARARPPGPPGRPGPPASGELDRWMLDAVLDSERLRDAVGAALLARLRAGYATGDPVAVRVAHAGAGVVAFEAALAEAARASA